MAGIACLKGGQYTTDCEIKLLCAIYIINLVFLIPEMPHGNDNLGDWEVPPVYTRLLGIGALRRAPVS